MGRFITKGGRTVTPSVLCAIAYTPTDRASGNGGYLNSAKDWSVLTVRRSRGQWRPVPSASATGCTTATAWSMVRAAGSQTRRVYVVSLCASDALSLLGFWDAIGRDGISLRPTESEYTDDNGRKRKRRPHPLVLSGTPDVIGWTDRAAEYRAVSLTNHLPCTITEAAQLVGRTPPSDPANARRPTGAEVYPAEWVAETLSLVYRRLLDRWQESQSGRWADTIGAAAYARWRQTVGEREVLIHDSPSAHGLECEACHGGRAQVWFFGPAGREWQKVTMSDDDDGLGIRPLEASIYKVDIRSMYASILRDERFPIQLLHRIPSPSTKALAASVDQYGVIARCTVAVDSPAFPFDAGERGIVYPVGEWETVLAGPELEMALSRGHIRSVRSAWLYRMGAPFRQFAEGLTKERMGCIRSGDIVGGHWAKAMANALGGKLASQKRGWTTVANRPCRRDWGAWAELDADSGEVVRCRAIAGIRQELVESGERKPGLTACYAWLTAYGRTRLLRMLETAGEKQVLACDTDGFIVTELGLSRLREVPGLMGENPGQLRVERELLSWQAITPKHYLADGKWTLAGARGDAGPVTNRKAKCWVAVSPLKRGCKPDPGGLPTDSYTLSIDAIPPSGTPGVDRWLIPPVVKGGALHQPTDRLSAEELAAGDY